MNKIILSSIILLYLNSSTAQYIPTSKACTVHNVIYDLLPLAEKCDFYNIQTEIIIQQTDPPLTGKINWDAHERLEPHNPECFGSFPL